MAEITVNLKEGFKKFGNFLNDKLGQYKADRTSKEQEMMKDLRQYRAKYDPDIQIEEGRSKVYPRDSRLKLIGFTAKMMEMMFPASEKNWSVTPEEYPNLAEEDLQAIIEKALAQKAQEAQQSGAAPEDLTSDDIAAAVDAFAKERANNMEKEIADQLTKMSVEYPQLCKHTIHSGGLYGWGVVVGPLTIAESQRVFERDETTGQWKAVTKQTLRPELERHRSWDIYPDMSARSWNQQEGLFHRYIFSRHDLTALTKRKDFMSEAIKQYLRDHDEGNYKPDSYEAELRALDDTANVKLGGRRYEVYRYFGFISGKQLSTIGIDIKDDQLYNDILVDIWFISGEGEGTVIKAEKAAFGEHVGDQYHPYFYDDEEEAGLLATSLMAVVRDSQLKLAAVDRMTMDNAAACLGPITEIDKARLHRNNPNPTIRAFSSVMVDTSEQPNNSNPVLRSFQPESHITELLELRREFKSVMDMESNVQPVSLGDPTGVGEAFRTSGNFSQLTGGANMMTKDQVRAFDRFTASVIGSLVKWNLEFNPKAEIKGDFQAIARGNISLVAKEVRGAALAQWRTTLTPREQVLLKTRDLLLEELKSRDLSTDILLSEADGAKALAAYDAAQAQAQQTDQDFTAARTQKTQAEAQTILASMKATIASISAKVDETIAKTKGEKTKHDLATIKLLLDQIGHSAAGEGQTDRSGEKPQK